MPARAVGFEPGGLGVGDAHPLSADVDRGEIFRLGEQLVLLRDRETIVELLAPRVGDDHTLIVAEDAPGGGPLALAKRNVLHDGLRQFFPVEEDAKNAQHVAVAASVLADAAGVDC